MRRIREDLTQADDSIRSLARRAGDSVGEVPRGRPPGLPRLLPIIEGNSTEDFDEHITGDDDHEDNEDADMVILSPRV